MDYIIIGGGPAGLYAAYQLLINKQDVQNKVLVLERGSRLGGRAWNEQFAGTTISPGAGVGRKHKDHHLLKLLDDLHIPHHDFVATKHYAPSVTPVELKETIHALKHTLARHPDIRTSFKDFARNVHKMSTEDYANFVVATGYSDFEKADVRDMLTYGMDEYLDGWTGFHVPWKLLIQKLAQEVRSLGGKIQLNADVASIHPSSSSIHNTTSYVVSASIQSTQSRQSTESNTRTLIKYDTKNVIVATTINPLRKLLPKCTIYKHIKSQPFLRVYGQFGKSKESRDLIASNVTAITITKQPIQEIIPMDPAKGVYMIAYSDNASAIALRDASIQYFEKRIAKELGLKQPIHITKIKHYFWKEGTHYYTPLPSKYKNRVQFIRDAQHPLPNVYVVGEVVTLDHGWTEGAFQSVHEVISTK